MLSSIKNKMNSASIKSMLWLVSEKIIRMFSGVIVGLWIARYLGPSQYGMYTFALAWVSLFNAIAWFGVGENVIRNLVREEGSEGELMGAAFAIRLFGSILAGVLAIAGILITHGNDLLLVKLVIFMSLAIPFAEMPAGIFLFFQSKLDVAKPVMAQNIIRILAAIFRIILVIGAFELIWFGFAILIESALICASLFLLYKIYGGKISTWRYRLSSIVLMLRQGAPIALASLVGSLSARTDQLMLGWFTNFSQVGMYSAALRFSEIWWSFAPIIMNSLSPKYIFNIENEAVLKQNISNIMAYLFLLSFIPVVGVLVLGQYAIPFLLGEQYADALPILYVHVFMAILIFFDAPTGQYLLAQQRQKQMIWKSFFLLLVNFMLNYLFIPLWGALGAAIATLCSYVLMQVVLYRMLPIFKDLADMQNQAFVVMLRIIRGKSIVWG
ncbi:flippase [Deefgea salmonis]|uniref:Flippase n=1 Tax=Deefgea salmonis TaxID=2875502 RepID=A0ABS8BJ80_9NEIS|nr:flippase [Deefgea salmonis]MCB5195591.1 flippase [Deefgea salmonis]